MNGQISYYYLSGTSMSSPHVAGIVALMAQKNPRLTAADAESILQSTALPLPPGTRTVVVPVNANFPTGRETLTWESDATGAGTGDRRCLRYTRRSRPARAKHRDLAVRGHRHTCNGSCIPQAPAT